MEQTTLHTLMMIAGIAFVLIFVIRPMFTNMMFTILKKALPPISATEREAIDAGTVSFEKGLFAGKPDWDDLLNLEKGKLTKEEQAFLDGPVRELCDKFDDYDYRDNKMLPKDIWDFLKKHKFFSLVASKEYGGLGLSTYAFSRIIAMLSFKSTGLAVTMVVPNALGPAKLLTKFGTQKQRDDYLPKLATGEYVPCFALTGVTSGSDAASMRDIGIIVKDKGKLKIKANFSKRYITLAPVATLIGLAVDVYDPDGLLGDDFEYSNPKTKHVGITLSLLKRNHKGLQIGNRHLIPVGFINGPMRGRDVMIDIDQVIGGKDYLGKGWVMLMACLGVGRSITKPGISDASLKASTYYALLYGGIRKQFNLPIAQMEGVVEKLSDCVHYTYVNDAARLLSVAQVDRGENPAVTSAIIKYASTEDARKCVNDCMDVLAGKAICDGPNNIMQNSYLGIPSDITVEGANILTRTLITFAQGAIRAHPYLFDEVEALYMKGEQQARKKFATVMTKHACAMAWNVIGNLVHNVTRGLLIGSPSGTIAPSKYYRMVNVQAKQFALLSDVVLLMLGGKVKAKQILSGRCADVLKNLYYAMATLKRFEDDNNTQSLPLLDYSMKRLCHENVCSMRGIIDNLPSPLMRLVLRGLLFPYGIIGLNMHQRPPTDAQKSKIVRTLYKDKSVMETLFEMPMSSGVFKELEQDYHTLQQAEPLYKKLKPFIRSQELIVSYDTNWVDEALKKGLISKAEAKQLHTAEAVYYKQVNVDEFTRDTRRYVDDLQTNLTA